MDATVLWWKFWTAAFVVAVASFGAIAAVVAVRGFADLRSLVRTLKGNKLGG